jgi:NADPH2:quinone reductase
LVVGASSAVGFYAVQMARLKGARVIGTVGSEAKTAMLRQAGMTDFIFYKQESVAERVRALTGDAGVDGLIDMDFSTTGPLVPAGAVASHGTIVSYGSNFRGEVGIDFSAWLPRSISLRFFLVYDLLPAERRSAIDGLSAWLHGGELVHHVGARFALDDIAQAHVAVETGAIHGNVVVTMT